MNSDNTNKNRGGMCGSNNGIVDAEKLDMLFRTYQQTLIELVIEEAKIERLKNIFIMLGTPQAKSKALTAIHEQFKLVDQLSDYALEVLKKLTNTDTNDSEDYNMNAYGRFKEDKESMKISLDSTVSCKIAYDKNFAGMDLTSLPEEADNEKDSTEEIKKEDKEKEEEEERYHESYFEDEEFQGFQELLDMSDDEWDEYWNSLEECMSYDNFWDGFKLFGSDDEDDYDDSGHEFSGSDESYWDDFEDEFDDEPEE